MKKITQAKIVSKLKKIFGYKNVYVLNSGSNNKKGIFDVLLPIDGEPVFIEIKIYPDKTSSVQNKFGERFYKSSFVLVYDNGLYSIKYFIGRSPILQKINELVLKLNGELK